MKGRIIHKGNIDLIRRTLPAASIEEATHDSKGKDVLQDAIKNASDQLQMIWKASNII